MSMVGKTFKQKMAAFLAVCMVASALPTGPVFAAEEPKEESSAASLVEFDVEKLKEAVEKAVKKEKMVTPPTVVASASVASFDTSSYELSRAEGLLKDGTKLPEDTDLRIFLVPDDLGYDADNTYTITGSESLIFMLENKGDEEQGYQLVFGNKITDVIEVKSKAQLLQEYELGEEETQTETTAATPSNADSIQEGQIAPENESQAQTQTEADSERNAQSGEQAAAPQESISEDSIQEGQVAPENETTAAETETAAEDAEETEAKAEESQAGETETETSRETEARETEKEETREESEEKEPIVISNPEKEDDKEEASQVTIGKIFDMLTGSIVAYGAEPEITATPSDASQEDKPAADVPGTSEPVKETSETSAPAESVAVETTEAEPEETTMAPAAEAAVPEQTAEKASPSNATEAEETVDRTFEGATGGYVKLNAEISTSTLIMRKDSFEKEKVTGILKPMARVMSLFAGDDTEDETKVTASSTRAVAFVTAAYSDVVALAETSNTNFQVNLYDYSGTEHNPAAINTYLEKQGVDVRFRSENNPVYNRYRDSSNKIVNIYQGIPELLGNSGILNALFPTTESTNRDAVNTYLGVDATGFFVQDENGFYTYDSSSSGARLSTKNNTNTLTKYDYRTDDDKGFWPFNDEKDIEYDQDNALWTAPNWFFGMSMAFDFYKPENGQFQGQDMIFSFSGDDDVWVYLTNEKGERELVLDLGGNHGRMDGWINFANGTVTYTNEFAAARERYNNGNVYSVNNVVYNPQTGTSCTTQNPGSTNVYSKYIRSDLQEFITSGSNFKLEFYYLERGGSASNCKLQFNLPVIPSQGITIQKQLSGKDLESHREQTFAFNVVSSNSREDLEVYRNSDGAETDDSNISVETFYVVGPANVSAEVEAGDYFYIEEVVEDSAKVSWNVSTSGGSQGTTEGTKSDIYQVPNDETQLGFLFLCTNQYGELTPVISKQAWKDHSITDEGVYDIVLSVTGDEFQTETTTGSAGALDIVFVMDRSTSIDENDFGDMKESIVSIAGGLEHGSKVSVIAFSGEVYRNNSDGVYGYNDPGATEYYVNVTNGWLNIETGGENDPSVVKLQQDLNRVNRSSCTHTAAGFLGAKHMLEQLDENDTNQKIVVFMTDGRPNTYVDQDTRETYEYVYVGPGNGDWSWDSRRGWRYTPGRGSYNLQAVTTTEYVFRSSDTNANILQEAKDTAIRFLKDVSGLASVYTISYKYSAGTGTADDSWMKEDSGNGVTKYYKAENIGDLEEALTDVIESATELTKVQNPHVTDVLSEYVTLYNGQTVTVSSADESETLTGPKLYLKPGNVEHTGNGTLGGTGLVELEASFGNGVVEYRISEDERLVATYTPSTSKIDWYVAESLGADETYSLTFRVQVTDKAVYNADGTYNDSPVKLSTTETTGTHDNETGYYSNAEAYLDYTDGQRMEFDKPVVQPVQAYTTVSLSKEIEGREPNEWSFDFQFGFNQPLKSDTNAELITTGIADELREFDYVYQVTVDSTDEQLVVITGIPIGATYKIVEIIENIEPYKVIDTKYAITSDSSQIESGSTTATSGEKTIPENGLSIEYTNELGEYSAIKIYKEVENTTSIDLTNTEYEFKVEYSADNGENWNIYKNNTGLKIKGGNYVTVKIEPEDIDKGYLFRITETNTQEAVRTDYQIGNGQVIQGRTTADIGILEEGSETKVTFINHYYSHSIILKKEVAEKSTGESEMINDADYTFIINFTVDEGSELRQVNVSRNDGTAKSVEVHNNSLTVTLKKDETLTISDLPAYVSGYTVTEDLGLLNTDEYTGGKFQVTLEGITASSDSGTNPTIDKTQAEVTGTFTGTANQIDTITYTNEYSYLLENLTITKELVASASDDTPTPADQDVTFTFEIVNQDTNESFTATVTVGKGESSGTVTIQVPVSKEGYEIQEISSTVRYKAKEDSVTAGKTENGYSAKFQNYKTGDDYFTSVSTIVNEVNGSYEFTNGGATAVERIASSLDAVGAYLLPDQKKDGSGDEDMNQPT